MKMKCFKLLILLFLGYINVFGQDTLKIETIDSNAIREFNPEVSLTEKEALVLIRSDCHFAFDSNVDKVIVISDSLQKDNLHYYAIRFNVPSRARRLRMISDDYRALTYLLGDLQPKEIRILNIKDPTDLFRKKLREGMNFFAKGNYEQAKTKFTEALAIALGQEPEEATVLIEKADLCIGAKVKAEQYYSTTKWCEAVAEYEKVIGANPLDTYCKEKYEAAYEKCMNTERTITGKVTNLQGQPVSGVSIVIEEQTTDKKGKVKYAWSKKAAKTNSAGEFKVTSLMKTRKFQYWLYHSKKYEIGITDDSDVVNIVINDGSSGGVFRSYSNNDTNNSSNSNSNSKLGTTNKQKSSLQSGGLNLRKNTE